MKDKYAIREEIDAIYDLMGMDDPVERGKLDALEWVIGLSDPPADMEGTGKEATLDEVKRCIELLKVDRNGLPEYSLFGDPNWRILDAQIEILQWVMTEDI